MPWLLRLVSLFVILAAAPTCARAIDLVQGERGPAPALRFFDLAGNETTLEAFKGRVVVLNLWAIWCAPCREEMPGLDRLQAMFDPREVLVLALSVDRGGNEKVLKFIQEIGTSRLAVYRDPKAEAARTLKVPGLPATILIDKAGNQAGRVLGIEQWDGPRAVAAVKALLAEPLG